MAIPLVCTDPRTCSKCGEKPAGPGRVLCTECKTQIEQANHAQPPWPEPDRHGPRNCRSSIPPVPPDPAAEAGNLF